MAQTPVVTGKLVRVALRDTIQRRIRQSLDFIGAAEGRTVGTLPAFRSYVSAFDTDKYEEDQVPACVIITPGLTSAPVRRGTGAYEATWSAAVGAIVSGQSPENTFELVELYAAAVRLAVLQERSLGGVASGTEWLDERYDELSFDDIRTIAAGIIGFAVTVETTVDDLGPVEPVVLSDADLVHADEVAGSI